MRRTQAPLSPSHDMCGTTGPGPWAESSAADLAAGFDHDFWCDSVGILRVTSSTGSPRQLADFEHRASVVSSLLTTTCNQGGRAPDERRPVHRSASTLAATNARYNPIHYHNGPCDAFMTPRSSPRACAATGCDEASRLAMSLLEAADGFSNRLPELFAGFDQPNDLPHRLQTVQPTGVGGGDAAAGPPNDARPRRGGRFVVRTHVADGHRAVELQRRCV